MQLDTLKSLLQKMDHLTFILPDGSIVPPHFHVTEVGRVTKDFIDCGGVRRTEEVANFQLWSSTDTDHRLTADKLLKIIALAQDTLEIGNLPIEVEYQGSTIGKYGLDSDGISLMLTSKMTACLAEDECGIPQDHTAVSLQNLILETDKKSCTPGGGCC